jgi:hypothetical protein
MASVLTEIDSEPRREHRALDVTAPQDALACAPYQDRFDVAFEIRQRPRRIDNRNFGPGYGAGARSAACRRAVLSNSAQKSPPVEARPIGQELPRKKAPEQRAQRPDSSREGFCQDVLCIWLLTDGVSPQTKRLV